MTTTLHTRRLMLRPISMDDAKDFFELDSNPKVHQFLGNNPVKTIDESRVMISSILEQYKTHGLGRLALIKKTTNEFIGWSGLKFEENLRKDMKYYDLGYRLKQEFWGKGYATEAARASLDYGFKVLNLVEICAAASEKNLASNAILKKIGMTPSGDFTYNEDICRWYTLKNPYL